MSKRSAALKAAMLITQKLAHGSQRAPLRPLSTAMDTLQANLRWMEQEWRMIRKARGRNWHLAAQQVEQRLVDALQAVERSTLVTERLLCGLKR